MRELVIDEITTLLTCADESVLPARIRDAVDGVLRTEPAAARLLHLLRADPALVTSRSAAMPRALERILDALATANPGLLRRPLCPSCEREGALVESNPAGAGRICAPCGRSARKGSARCGLCGLETARHAGVACINYCQSCWKRLKPQATARIAAILTARFPTIDTRNVLEEVPGGPDRVLRLALELEGFGAAWFANPAAGSVQFAHFYELLRRAGIPLPARTCGSCEEVTSSQCRRNGLLCCRRCYSHGRREPCDGCGRTQILERRLADGRRLCQPCSRQRPEAAAACIRCGAHRPIRFRTPQGPICQACRNLARLDTCTSCGRDATCRFAGTPAAICDPCATSREVCHLCSNNHRVHSRTTTGKPICHGCAPPIVEACIDCGLEQRVRGRVAGGPLCGACLPKNPATWRECHRCGRREHLNTARLCPRCHADDLIEALFPPAILASDNRVEDLHAACLAADAHVILSVFRRKTTITLLRDLLRTPDEISHERLDGYGSAAGTATIRALLVEHGVIPPRNEPLARLERWIHHTAEALPDPVEARAFTRFARWRHLRHLRELPPSTPSSTARSRRRELALVAELLTWARLRGRTLATLTQADIDRWRATGPAERHRVKAFLVWARRNNLTAQITITHQFSRALTVAGLDDDSRWRLLAGVFAAETTPAPSRLAAALVLLYGIRVSRLIQLRLTDIEDHDGEMLIRLGSVPLALPDELGEIATATTRARTAARMFGPVHETGWLFPGTTPGQSLSADALTDRIRRLGVLPSHARTGALTSLAQQLPAPIMARLIGLHPTTAGRWTDTVSASHANYAAQRLPDTNPPEAP